VRSRRNSNIGVQIGVTDFLPGEFNDALRHIAVTVSLPWFKSAASSAVNKKLFRGAGADVRIPKLGVRQNSRRAFSRRHVCATIKKNPVIRVWKFFVRRAAQIAPGKSRKFFDLLVIDDPRTFRTFRLPTRKWPSR